jgi:RNA polymerase sigma-70 factor (ECF subfamily)
MERVQRHMPQETYVGVAILTEHDMTSATTRAATFESFFREAYGQLVRALTPLTQDAAAAEEVVQEAMARAYDRWDRVARMESPIGYVYTTAVNLHRRQRRRSLARFVPERSAGAAPDPADTVATRTDLLAALGALPQGQRDALLLVQWLGVDAAAAGRILGIEPSSVRARIHRARETLQHQLTR